MDFHTLSRRDLQALCKKNHIPANVTNVAMANALQALQMVEGIEELQEALNFQSPKTTQRTGSHKPVGPAEDQASSLPRSRRVTSRTPAALNLADEEEKKKEVVAETPKVPNTRRRAGQKDESKEIVETMRKSTRTSVVRGVEAQKEEKVVGVTTGRRTRGTVKKEVEFVSGGMRRSSRARGIAMASLAKEELEEGKESGEVVVETTEEKVDDKAEELEEQKVDDNAEEQEEERVEDKAEQVDEVDDTAEEQEKVDDKADEVEEEEETGEVAVETNEEKVDKKAEEQEEEEQEKFVDKAGENEEMTDDVAEQVEEKETNDIMEEGEIKSSDQTYHDLIMSEDGDFADQMSDLQSEEMVVETSKEDQVDDKAEQDEEEIDVQVDHEKEETDDQADEKLEDNVEPEEETMDVQAELEDEKLDYQAEGKLEDKPEKEEEEEEEQTDDQIEQEEERVMEDTVEEEIKSLEGNTCNDLVMVVDEESVDQKNDIKYEEMTIQGEKLEDKPEEEEEQIDDQIEQEEGREMEDIVEEEIKSLEGNTCNDLVMGVDEESVDQKNDIKYEEMVMQGEKLEDNPEEEEIDDQIEQQEVGEMEDTLEEEMKSLEGNTCNDLVMAVDEESVDQKNDIKYEEMAAVMAMQGEKLENKPEQQEEEQTDDHVEHEEENEMDDIVEEEIQSLEENSSDIIISQVEEREECSEFVEEAAIINESSPIRCPITSDQTSSNEEQQNPIVTNDESGKETGNMQIGELIDNLSDLNLSLKEDIRDPITCEEQQNRDAEEDENVKRSSGNIQIGELIDNLSYLNLSLKEEIKAGDGVLPGRENNKENSWVAKSKTQKNYEDMSLRKLKAAYKEVVVAMNKGEEKRAALKIIDENCS